MRKLFTLLILMFLWAGSSWGQANTYSFASSTGTYTAITGGTLLKDGTTAQDSWASTAQTIPSFTFNGVAYTTAYVTSNGILTLGGVAPSAFTSTGISTTTGSGIAICPFSADLDRATTTASTEIRWETVINEVVFQWQQVKRYGSTNLESFDMQVRLNTVSGNVVFIYQLNTGPGTSTSYQPQVGIRTSTTDYKNRLVSTGTEDWATSLAGISNTSACRFTSVAPAKSFTTGLTYTFTPPPPCTGTPDPGNTLASVTSACTGLNFTLSLQNAIPGTGVTYQWQSSLTGAAPWTDMGTASTQTASQTAATYYRCVATCTNSGQSGTSTPLLVTMNLVSAPYVEGFLTTTTPTCWNITGWIIGSARGVTGNPGNNIYKNLYSSAPTGTFTTGLIGPVASGMFLTFDYKFANYASPYAPPVAGSGSYVVSVSNNDGASFTDLETVNNEEIAGWLSKSYNLSAYVGTNIIIKVVGTWITGDYDLAFDNVKVQVPPSCLEPTALAVANITNSSATINWTASASNPSGGYQIYYSTSSTPPTESTTPSGTVGAGVTTYNMTPLTANTPYFVWVRSNCGATTFSTWAGPVIFTTLCDAATTLNENFDAVTAPAIPSCWAKYTSPSFSFATVTTVASLPASAPNCVQLYSSGALLAVDAPLLISPALSNLGAGTYQLKFAAKGASTNLSVIIGTMSDPLNAATFTPFQTVTGLNTATWTTCIVSFASYSGTDQYIAFAHPLTTTYSYVYIDDVVWELLPACAQPSALTATNITGSSADLSWNANGTTAWEIEWGAAGFLQGNGTIINSGVTNPYTLGGLSPVTPYSYYVRANCGGNGYSLWTGPYNFTTIVACPAPTAQVVTGITTEEAYLGWTSSGSLWNIEYGLAGFVQGTGTTISSSTNPKRISSLLANTAYSWYVQQDCGGGTLSTWTGPNTFTTACDAVSLPFGPETFAVAVPPSCWTRYSGLLAAPSILTTMTFGWTQDDWRNVTSPVNKAAKVNVYGTSVRYWLMTPQINLGAGSATLRLEFDLALNEWNTSTAPGAGPDDRFAVVISTDGGSTWTSANTLREWNNTGSAYVYDNINFATGEHVIIPLAGYTGNIMIGFYTESTVSNGDNDLMIDNVVIQEPPACSAPSAILASVITATTATISWTAPSPAPGSGYQWEVRTSGAGGSGATGLAQSGSTAAGVVTANVTGLTSATSYNVYVRSNCGSGEFSTWAGPTAFSTLCNVSATPFTEDFEATTFPPACWTKTASPTWIRSSSASGYGAGTGSASAPFYGISSATPFDLVTFAFDASALTTPTLSFDYAYATYTGGEVDQMDVYYSTDNGTTWELLLAMPGGETGILNTGGITGSPFVPTSAQWATQTLSIPAGTDFIKFQAISEWGNNLYLDNVKVFSPLAHDVAALSVDLYDVVAAGSVTPLATVKNEGTNTETFTVTMTIGGSYTSTKTVTALGSGLTQQVTFDPWTATVGNYTATVTTNLASDEFAGNNTASKALKVLELNKVVYGYNAFAGSGTDPEGPTSFNLATPGILNSIADQSLLNFVSGGTWANGIWYGTVSNTAIPYQFISIDPATGARTVLGDMGLAMNGLSYNAANNTMYGVTATSLYTINMADGTVTLVGTNTGIAMVNLAISLDGVAYSIDLVNAVLGTVDLTTGVFTPIGSIGFDANYAQDMEFDRETGNLFVAAYGTTGQLRLADLTTGNTLLIGEFEGGAEITGFAIPYVPTKTLNVTAFLEAFYLGGGVMREAKDAGGVIAHFGDGVADEVTIELHDAGNYNAPPLHSATVYLSTLGVATVTDVPASLGDSYYVTIKHRSSIETTSALPVDFSGTTINYNFTTAASQAYADPSYLRTAQIPLGGGLFGIWGGNAFQDGIIDGSDMGLIDNASAGDPLTGYNIQDINGDGIVDGTDMGIIDNNSANPPVTVQIP